MKRIFICFLIILSCISFSGCSQKGKEIELSKEYIMFSLSTGSEISQTINFSVNSDMIRSVAKSEGEYQNFLKELIKSIDKIRMKFLFSIALKYMQNPIEEYMINKGVLFSQTKYDSRIDSVGFTITFTSLSAWMFYHLENKQEEVGENTHLFYQKIYNNSSFPFAEVDSNGRTAGDIYAGSYKSALDGFSFEEEVKQSYNPDFVYNYVCTQSRINSNADYSFLADGKYYHVWKSNSDDLGDDKAIEIWVYEIYPSHWYLAILLTSMFGIILAIIIVKIVKKHKKI